MHKLVIFVICNGLTTSALADSFHSTENVYCMKSKTGNMHFEQCKDRTSGLTWSRTTIEAGDNQYLRGTDKEGNKWTAIREIQGKRYKTTYSDNFGNTIRVEECNVNNCTETVMN
ncbi:hypothetical protein [Vibrio sp. YIC-376]|uniref:hypothetical protein n=1 Tax=Vibrio sp. YIC-376 TaxID=3136162 RepID=UPI00402ADCF9